MICVGETYRNQRLFVLNGPNMFTATTQNPTRDITTLGDAGEYSLTVTNGFGCSSSGMTPTVDVTDLSDLMIIRRAQPYVRAMI